MRDFHLLAKPIGPICNLKCRYCFYLEKEMLYPRKSEMADWVLQESVLEEYIRQYIRVTIVFGDLLCMARRRTDSAWSRIFPRVVVLQQRYANGKQIENTLQTNGILLDDQWCEFPCRERLPDWAIDRWAPSSP